MFVTITSSVRPTKIEVVCPKCSGYAVAKEPLNAQGCFVVGDLCSSWEIPSFNVVCTQCNYRAVNVGYHQLTEPFHQIAHNGTVLWAWNLDHLLLLYDFLQKRNVNKSPYSFFLTYVHKNWLKKRTIFVKLIKRYIAQQGAICR